MKLKRETAATSGIIIAGVLDYLYNEHSLLFDFHFFLKFANPKTSKLNLNKFNSEPTSGQTKGIDL